MDDGQFDALTKGLASPSTRRRALGGLAGGGLLGALGFTRVASAAASSRPSCILTLTAAVRMGPDVDKMLHAGAAKPGELRGKLTFSLSPTGGIDDGKLLLADGKTQLPVVGQATGRSLNLRIAVGRAAPLVLIGVAEQEILACNGAVDGVATGPRAGDLGDWHGSLSSPPSGSAPAGGGTPPTGGAATVPPSGQTTSTGSTATASAPASSTATMSAPTGTATATATPTMTPTPVPCAKTSESCASAACCIGYCDQNNLCDCVPDGTQCQQIGTGGCCSGTPCNADGFCGACVVLNGACVTDADCCSGQIAALCCFDGTRLANICTEVGAAGACPGQAPVAGCPAGQTACGASCSDLSSDARNCGACGHSCGLGAVCTGGACVAPAACLPDGAVCALDTDCCGGFCIVGVLGNPNSCSH